MKDCGRLEGTLSRVGTLCTNILALAEGSSPTCLTALKQIFLRKGFIATGFILMIYFCFKSIELHSHFLLFLKGCWTACICKLSHVHEHFLENVLIGHSSEQTCKRWDLTDRHAQRMICVCCFQQCCTPESWRSISFGDLWYWTIRS